MKLERYNKLWGAIVGGVAAVAIVVFGVGTGTVEELTGPAITLGGAALAVYFAPSNK